MITINPVKLNNTKPVTFGEGNLNNVTPNVAILSLQNPNAKVNFEKDMFLTQKADAVQENPLTALAYKLVKTYRYALNKQPRTEVQSQPQIEQRFSTIA